MFSLYLRQNQTKYSFKSNKVFFIPSFHYYHTSFTLKFKSNQAQAGKESRKQEFLWSLVKGREVPTTRREPGLEGASLRHVEAGKSLGHHKMDKKVWFAQLLTVQSQHQQAGESPS